MINSQQKGEKNMHNNKMNNSLKSIGLSFYTGQILLLIASGYLLFNNKELWLYPMGLLSLQQILLWGSTIYFNKKRN